MSFWVQAFPSLQLAPLAAAGLEHAPVLGLHAPATWHWSDAVHVTGFAPTQVPLWHASTCVHALPSLQLVPFGAVGLEHAPVCGLHEPATWHWSLAVQLTGFAPVHVPALHVSVCVQASPSLQVIPSAAAGFEQTPLLGSHVPATWHWSLAVHATGFEPVQTAFWHVYVCSHLFVPLQAVPLAAGVWLHVPSPLHASTVHGLPSSHFEGVQHSPPAV
jgi:hypothetical protein